LAQASIAFARTALLLGQISFDHSDEQTDQKFPLAWRDWGENAFVGREVYGAQPRVNLLAFWRQAKKPRASVGSVHAALNQFLFHKLLDEQACRVAIDVEPIGKVVLFDPRPAGQCAEVDQHPVLQWSEVGFANHRGGLGYTYLVKPPSYGGRHPMPWRINISRYHWW
jgi:hypothetical protein